MKPKAIPKLFCSLKVTQEGESSVQSEGKKGLDKTVADRVCCGASRPKAKH